MSASSTGGPDLRPPVSSRSRLRALVILAIFLVAVVAAAITGWRFAEASKPVGGPILLISIDALRADHLPIYGGTHIATPNIDRLARTSFVFERAYAHVPGTLPSHASLLTGLLPFEHGVRDDVGFALGGDHATLPALLHDRGFATGAAVSSYLLRRGTGLDRGFATYDDGSRPDREEDDDADAPVKASRVLVAPAATRDGAETVGAATRWIERQADPRFFYFVHLDEPRLAGADPSKAADPRSYDAAIVRADQLVGQVLSTLERRNLYDDALIVLTSDHGEGRGDRGEQGHGLLLNESVLRVPLTIKMPGARESHRVSMPVQHIDLLPTLLDLARAPRQEHLRGRSLRALLEEDDVEIPAQPMYAEALAGYYHWGLSAQYALTDGVNRLVVGTRPALYDLRADASEQVDRASSDASLSKALTDALSKLTPRSELPEPARTSELERETLMALGYGALHPVPPVPPDRDRTTAADPRATLALVDAERRALALAAAGRSREACLVIESLLSERPDAADLWRQLGEFALRDGRAEDAITAFERFSALRPDRPEGAIAIARVLLDFGRVDDASRYAERALNAAPPGEARTQGAASEVAIRAALAHHDITLARRFAAEAQALFPALALGPYVEARLLHEQGDFEGAAPLFEQAAEVSAAIGFDIGELQWYLGDALSRLDRFADAEAAFARAIAASPRTPRNYASLATLYHASHRDALADQTLAALARAVPAPAGAEMAARLRATFGH